MKRVHIIYKNFLDENDALQIGGIETYLFHLAQVLTDAGYRVSVVQEGQTQRRVELPYATVHKVTCNSRDPYTDLVKYTEGNFDESGCVVFGAHTAVRHIAFEKTVAIQHGIHWDGAEVPRVPRGLAWIYPVARFAEARKTIRLVKGVGSVVCVDYNFVNWLRTQGCRTLPRLRVIPNFVDTGKRPNRDYERDDSKVNIVFARRFVERRGVELLVAALPGIIERHPNVSLTIAGEGPMEGYLRDAFRDMGCVKFTKYQAEDSIAFHSQFDIALVPTVFSEGTSFSLLEAMYAGCCVLCTNVGGMTNIVLDGFNGRMVPPEVDAFSRAVEELVVDAGMRERLARNASKSVAEGFSLRTWGERWTEVMEDVFDGSR